MLRFVLLMIIASRAADACWCGGSQSIREAWREVPAVFLGTVELADPDGNTRETMFREQTVRIRVDEAFKGVSKGQAIELQQAGFDCAAKFRSGQRAVFYLHPGAARGSWIVLPCSHAIGSADPVGDDLLFLHGLPGSAAGTRLSGTVDMYEDKLAEPSYRGIPNVTVEISAPGGAIRKAVTNENGVYEVYGLPPGRYSVSLEVPKGLKVSFPVTPGFLPAQGNEAAVELAPEGDASVGFVLKADTRVSGRMLDARGVPIDGVCLNLEPLEGRGEDGARFFNSSKAGGVFEMNMMPPGSYRLVARDEVKGNDLQSQSTLYYPGVRDRASSRIIEVDAGRYIQDLELRVPSDEKRYRIAGRFQFADGAPVTNAEVTFTSEQHGYSETTSTGADGSFAFSRVAGMDGEVKGQLMLSESDLRACPQFEAGSLLDDGIMRLMDAAPVALPPNSDRSDLKLELPFPSCKAWPPRRE